MKRMLHSTTGATLAALLVILAVVPACSTDPEKAKTEFLQSGDRFAAEKKYQEAIVQYRNALQQDAQFGEARLKLAETYETLGDASNAYREFIRAADSLPGRADVQARAASYLLLAGQFEDARARAEKALAIDPRHLDAQIILGNALSGLKDFDKALSQLEEAVKLDPKSAAGYASLGAVQLARGSRDQAEAAFRTAVDGNPQNPAAHFALGNFLWATGRPLDAEASFKKALELEPSNLIAHRALATLYLATRRAPEAEPHLRALADQDSSASAPGKLALADYYLALDNADAAVKVLEPLTTTKGASSAALTRMAAIRYVKDGKVQGHKVIDEVLAADPKYVGALLTKTRFLLAEGLLEDALKSAQAAAAADQRSIEAQYLIGLIQRARRQPAEAVAAFNEVLKINPQAVAAQVHLAELNLASGQSGSAVQLATDADRVLPGNPRVKLTLVRSLIASGDVARATQELQPLLDRFGGVAVVQVAAGQLALAKSNVRGARDAFSRAAAIDRDNLDALRGLVAVDLAERKPDAARTRVESELGRRPDHPGLLMLLARVVATQGNSARAEELLKKAIEIDPSNLTAYGMLARLYMADKRLADARASFESILKEQPDSVFVQTMIGLLYEAEGNSVEARKRYERVMQLDPSAAVAANNLAYMYAEEGGNLDTALQLAQVARQKVPESAEIADTVGWVYVKKNMGALAVSHFEHALARDPQSALYTYHLGLALAQTGQKIKARQSLERALTLNPDPDTAAKVRASLDQL